MDIRGVTAHAEDNDRQQVGKRVHELANPCPPGRDGGYELLAVVDDERLGVRQASDGVVVLSSDVSEGISGPPPKTRAVLFSSVS